MSILNDNYISTIKTVIVKIKWNNICKEKRPLLAEACTLLSQNIDFINQTNIIIRGQIFLNYNIIEILDILSDIKYRKELEPSIDIYPPIHWLSTHTGIEYVKYKGIWPAKPRDICNLLHWRLLKNGLFLYYISPISSPLYPEQLGTVRSNLTLGGFVMRHVPGGTMVFLIVEVKNSRIYSLLLFLFSLDNFQLSSLDSLFSLLFFSLFSSYYYFLNRHFLSEMYQKVLLH